MTEGVKIRYGDVAPEAKENFIPTVTDKANFVDLAQLQQYNLQFLNYANPCEYGSVLLDSASNPFPAVPTSENIGLWSNSISGSDGTFSTPVILTLESEGQYSSQGFTLTFDTYNNIFCNNLNIKWYRNGEQIETYNFQPDSAFYFCRKQVSNYDKVVITFYSLNMPYNRLKLRVIDYGYGTYFTGEELRNVKAILELNPISSELAINTVDFTLDSKSDMEYSFQSKQPLSVYFNDNLIATTFVTNSNRKSQRQWDIQSEDYIGMLDKITFMGGMYTSQNAVELLQSILTQAKVPCNINSALNSATVTGYIPICTCREAIMHICFAIGAVADTSYSDKLEIYVLPDEVIQTIPLERIMQGQKFDDGATVTEVQLTQHAYKANTESVEAFTAAESGTGTNILVKFSEPLHTLSISNGTITSSAANYAIITANEGCVLSGKKYSDTTIVKSHKNSVVAASDLDNVVSITDATLVTSANVDDVLEKAYNYLTKTNKVSLKIIEGKHLIKYGMVKYGAKKYGKEWEYDSTVRVGETITAETEYLGNKTGVIVAERFNLNGGILIKECEMI